MEISRRATETQRIRDFMQLCDHLTTHQFHRMGETSTGKAYRRLVKLHVSADDMNAGTLLICFFKFVAHCTRPHKKRSGGISAATTFPRITLSTYHACFRFSARPATPSRSSNADVGSGVTVMAADTLKDSVPCPAVANPTLIACRLSVVFMTVCEYKV